MPTLMFSVLFYTPTATSEIYTLSLHDALPIFEQIAQHGVAGCLHEQLRGHAGNQLRASEAAAFFLRNHHPDREHRPGRSEEHTSELQSLRHLVCRLLLEKKKENRVTTSETPAD